MRRPGVRVPSRPPSFKRLRACQTLLPRTLAGSLPTRDFSEVSEQTEMLGLVVGLYEMIYRTSTGSRSLVFFNLEAQKRWMASTASLFAEEITTRPPLGISANEY